MRHIHIVLTIVMILLADPRAAVAQPSARSSAQLRPPATLATTLPCDLVLELKSSTHLPKTLYGTCESTGGRRDRNQGGSVKILHIGLESPSPTIQTFALPATFTPEKKNFLNAWSGDIVEVGPQRYAVSFDIFDDEALEQQTLKTGFAIVSLAAQQLMRHDLPSTAYFMKPLYTGSGTVKDDAGNIITSVKPETIRGIDYLEENSSIYLLVHSREKKISKNDYDWVPDLLMRYSLASAPDKPILKEFRDILPSSWMMALVGRVGKQYVVVWSAPGGNVHLPVFNALYKFMPEQFPAPIDLDAYPLLAWPSAHSPPVLIPIPLKPLGVLGITNSLWFDDPFNPNLLGAQIAIYDVDASALFPPQPLLIGAEQPAIFEPSYATAADAQGNVFIAHLDLPILRHGLVDPWPKTPKANPVQMTPLTALANHPGCNEPQTMEALAALAKEGGASIDDILCPGVIEAMAIANNALYIARGNALLRMPIQ